MRKVVLIIFTFTICTFMWGCTKEMRQENKIRDIDFTVVDEAELPEEFRKEIDEKKEQPFQMTYMKQGYLYIAVGYGKQNTSGYSIRVKECCELETKIRFLTELLGPDANEKIIQANTWPWIAIKIEETDKAVVFTESDK